jgi:hypothetical protein
VGRGKRLNEVGGKGSRQGARFTGGRMEQNLAGGSKVARRFKGDERKS